MWIFHFFFRLSVIKTSGLHFLETTSLFLTLMEYVNRPTLENICPRRRSFIVASIRMFGNELFLHVDFMEYLFNYCECIDQRVLSYSKNQYQGKVIKINLTCFLLEMPTLLYVSCQRLERMFFFESLYKLPFNSLQGVSKVSAQLCFQTRY